MGADFEAADFGFSGADKKKTGKKHSRRSYRFQGRTAGSGEKTDFKAPEANDTGFSAAIDTAFSEVSNRVNSFAGVVAGVGSFAASFDEKSSGEDGDKDISDDLVDSVGAAGKGVKDKVSKDINKKKQRVRQARKYIYDQYKKEMRVKYQGRNPEAQNANGTQNTFQNGNQFAGYENGSSQGASSSSGISPEFASNANGFGEGGLFTEANISGDFDNQRRAQRVKTYSERMKASKNAAKNRASKEMKKEAKRKAERDARKKAQKSAVKRSYKKASVSARNVARNAGTAAAEGAKEGTKAAAESAASTAASTAAEAGAAAGTSAASSGAAAGGWVTLIIAVVIIIIIILICVLLYNAFVPAAASFVASGGAYQSEALDIDEAEETLQLLEVDLKKEILSIETDHPDYDEYDYDPANMADYVRHNPWTLVNYLSSLKFAFTKSEVEEEIKSLFADMYELKYESKTETRIRYVVDTRPVLDEDGEPVIDEETGEEVYEEYLKPEEYDVDILCITLTTKSLEEIVAERLEGNDDAKELYEIYSETKGLRQCFDSPIEGGFESLISSYYGWRIHPITGDKRFHKGLDIAVPEGTEVHSAQDGVVIYTGYEEEGYGYYVVVENDDGYKSLYAHLSEIKSSVGDEVKSGEVIALSGNTGGSTGPHLHLEVFYEGKNYNPLFYVDSG